MRQNRKLTFSDSYCDARERLIAAFERLRCGVHYRYVNKIAPATGKVTLSTDVLVVDEHRSDAALVLVSGTHGVEGYCGSAVQTSLLQSWADDITSLPCALVLVHAINPYGFANDRRVTEDNVDLNRNFVDFDADLPENPEYEKLHPALVPRNWLGSERAAADDLLAQYIAAHGQKSFQAAVLGGQYVCADGLFYGGRSPSWSNLTWRKIIDEHLGRYKSIALVDLHTGLGPFGRGEAIFVGAPDGPAKAIARKWFGEDVTCPSDGSSVSTAIQGPLGLALELSLPDSRVISMALEFGTYPIEDILEALRADNWLYINGRLDTDLAQQIKAKIRRAFYPDSLAWQCMVLERADEMISMAFDGFSRMGAGADP